MHTADPLLPVSNSTMICQSLQVSGFGKRYGLGNWFGRMIEGNIAKCLHTDCLENVLRTRDDVQL